MPEEEKADALTPADLRRRQGSGTLVFSIFLIFVVAGLIGTVLAVNDGRNYKRLVIRLGLENYLFPAIAPPDIRIDRLKPGPAAANYPPKLLSASVDATATLQKVHKIEPEDRCKKLKGESGRDAQFSKLSNGWECTFLQEFGVSSAEPASIFIQARGAEPDIFYSLRIKLNLTDPAVEPFVIRDAIAATLHYDLPMTVETRAYLTEMMTARRTFSSTFENYRITFGSEMMDRRRFNLVILPLPQTINCGDKLPEPRDRRSDMEYRMPIGCRALGGSSALRPTI